ncbi:NAD(P)-binding protein [Nostoc favosum]|uniref:NAD(P)-binding protein n=1 Tax=Nostoc favosum TaxID=2907819 RepID=UPI002279CEE0|nr:NAD(P)-binding protein [Nostoc favosum]
MLFDWLIVGAGYSACVMAERLATQLGHRVLIVEQRDHIGGNAYDYYNEHGILVHKYGPHIFHTKSKKVWDYLSHFQIKKYPTVHSQQSTVNNFKRLFLFLGVPIANSM